MNTRQEKMMRLADVARKYYIEDKKQSDIAKELGVSRPLISRMLTEAKALGLVEITIHDPWQRSAVFLEKLQKRWQIQDAVLQEDLEDDRSTNIMLSESTIGLLEKIGAKKIGIGWGHFIGQLVAWLEQHPQKDTGIQDIYPLLGNAGVPIRNYHSNENVRILAENLSATPHFLYLPALPESLEEKKLLCSTELYKQFEKNWQEIDAALVNIGNYPSTPDFDLVSDTEICFRKKEYAAGFWRIISMNRERLWIPVRILLFRHPWKHYRSAKLLSDYVPRTQVSKP